MKSRNDYRVGWICALPVEMAAAQAMLDTVHPAISPLNGDPNTYLLGSIGPHNIVVTCLPAGLYGTTFATVTAVHMSQAFRSIEICFMVGIGGGVPGDHDIRLGDVVVSEPTAHYGGVMQYDRGKAVEGGHTTPTGVLNKPPELILRTLCAFKAGHMLHGNCVRALYDEALKKYPLLRDKAGYPGREADHLFVTEYSHAVAEANCQDCDPSMLRCRVPRADDEVRIFYGLIASGNQVIKDAKLRDQLGKKYDIFCFEMEAAGLMDIFPSLVVRGICDYADSHKNKEWQGYAAVVAAAYTKELLLYLSPRTYTPKEQPVPQDCDNVTASITSDLNSVTSPSILKNHQQQPATENQEKAMSETESAPVLIDRDLHLPAPGNASTVTHTQQNESSSEVSLISGSLVSRLDSRSVLESNLAISRRLGLWHPWPTMDCSGVFRKLKNWLSVSGSSVLIATSETSRNSRWSTFATEVTAHLVQWRKTHSSDYGVVWVLRSGQAANNDRVENLKSFVSEIIHLYPNSLTSELMISADRNYQENELWQTLHQLLKRVKKVFVVLRTRDVELASRMVALASEVLSAGDSQVKFLIVYVSKIVFDLQSAKGHWDIVHIRPESPVLSRFRFQQGSMKSMSWESLIPSFGNN